MRWVPGTPTDFFSACASLLLHLSQSAFTIFTNSVQQCEIMESGRKKKPVGSENGASMLQSFLVQLSSLLDLRFSPSFFFFVQSFVTI